MCRKRIIALFLAVVMVCTLLPAGAFAAAVVDIGTSSEASAYSTVISIKAK